MVLTILVVTRYGAHAAPFLFAFDEFAEDVDAELVEYDGTHARCIEDVLDAAISECEDGYILRLDDDELPSDEMRWWIRKRVYECDDHWAFPRLNLYPDADHFITNPPLWPDLQTRLSVKAKAGGRTGIHAGSPYGTGQVAPCAIEHHKFLVRSVAARRQLVADYESIQTGAGVFFSPFSVPEDFQVQTAPRSEAIRVES